MNNKQTINFLLVGVGGQGTILASNVLAEVGLQVGFDTKQAEVHGMSQRGGSVTSQIRWGSEVFSPIIPQGEVDYLVAFEKMEAVRYIGQLKPEGYVIVNDYQITPVTVSSGAALYPDDEKLQMILTTNTSSTYWIDGFKIASDAGNAKVANVVILGALCKLLHSNPAMWLEVISKKVPAKYTEVNNRAFECGYKSI